MATRKLGFTALMTAIYGRLTTHVLTNAYSFHNYVPKNTAYPYHIIGKAMGVVSWEYTSRDSEAEENSFQIDSWVDKTSGFGDKACADMQNNIIQAITSSALSISGYSNIYFNLEYSDIMDDPDHPEISLKHGILRFRQIMNPT